MTNSITNAFIYENLKPIAQFNDYTNLCIYEPTHKLFVVKKADISSQPTYEALLTLNNPYLAKLFYIANKEDHLEIVREYISGDPLAELLENQKYLAANSAVKIAANICKGLADLHKLGLVHRDINPNNIIISSNDCVKIIDFGITRNFSGNKTSDTTILGTPGYAAPEQFGFSQSDARTDIYAVGVLLNVMLTGCLPNEKIAAGSLGKIVKKCTEIDSHHRYSTITELSEALLNKASNDPMDQIIKQIPGLRSSNTAVIILSIIGYLLLIIYTVGLFLSVKNGAYFPTIISWILCFPIPYFCFNNFLDIWNKLPFSQGASKRNQRIVYTVLGIVSILFGLLVIGITNQP